MDQRRVGSGRSGHQEPAFGGVHADSVVGHREDGAGPLPAAPNRHPAPGLSVGEPMSYGILDQGLEDEGGDLEAEDVGVGLDVKREPAPEA